VAEGDERDAQSLPTMNDAEEQPVPADEQERVKPLHPVHEEVPPASEADGQVFTAVFEVEPIPASGEPLSAALHPPVEAVDAADEPSLEPVPSPRLAR
jgi:hypothetical protein